MERNTLISYAESFASFLLDTKIAKHMDRIILFGSVARGDFDRESDIDIFVDTSRDIGKDVLSTLNLFKESEINRKWKLRGVGNEISVKTGKLDEWDLRRNVISNGIILYGKFKEVPENVKYYLLVKMNFSKMKRKEKIKIWRKLYGYKQKVGSKIYESGGLLKELGGKKIENGVILVPMGKKGEIIGFLSESGVEYQVNEIWSDSL